MSLNSLISNLLREIIIQLSQSNQNFDWLFSLLFDIYIKAQNR